MKHGEEFEFNIDIEELINDALSIDEDSDTDKIQQLYDILTFKNRTYILSDIRDDTGRAVYQQILLWNMLDKNKPIEKREPIKIYIDSPGGSLIDGFETIDAIIHSKTPVYTIVTGSAYSCGLFIAAAGHKRYAMPHSSFMFHEGSIGSDRLDAHKFKKYSEFYYVQLEQLRDFILKYTKITPEEYDRIIKDDNWYTAEQALEKGIIDEILAEVI